MIYENFKLMYLYLYTYILGEIFLFAIFIFIYINTFSLFCMKMELGNGL